MLKLHEIGDALLLAIEALIENGGELTPELEEQLGALEGAFDEKVEELGLVVKNLEHTAKCYELEVERLAAHKKAQENAAKRLKQYIGDLMAKADKKQAGGLLCRGTIQPNSRPSIAWLGAVEEIPAEFKKVTVALDGDAAYRAWKAAKALPEGFEVKLGSHLRLR